MDVLSLKVMVVLKLLLEDMELALELMELMVLDLLPDLTVLQWEVWATKIMEEEEEDIIIMDMDVTEEDIMEEEEEDIILEVPENGEIKQDLMDKLIVEDMVTHKLSLEDTEQVPELMELMVLDLLPDLIVGHLDHLATWAKCGDLIKFLYF